MSKATGRWKRRAAARPDEILDAALEVFMAAGFDTARMDDIAAQAGISKAGVYLYFDSKQALLRALISREVAPVAAQIAGLAEAGKADPEATLRAMAATAMSRLNDPRLFAVPRLMISVSNRFPDIVAQYRTEVVERAAGALAGLIAAGTAKGVFRPVDPHLAVRAIIGPVMFAALWRHVLDGADPVLTQTTLEGQLDLLLNGLRP